MTAKPRRRSAATKALEELAKLVDEMQLMLSTRASDKPDADYAMRCGGAKHYAAEMRRVIEAAQKESGK